MDFKSMGRASFKGTAVVTALVLTRVKEMDCKVRVGAPLDWRL